MLFSKKSKFSMLLLSLILVANLCANLVTYAMTADEVIVDDKDSSFYKYGDVSTNVGADGKWVNNTSASTNYLGSHWWCTGVNGEYATYTPSLKGGVYEIYTYVPYSDAYSSKNISVEIYGATAKDKTQYSIFSFESLVVPTGFLKLAGTYTFEPGSKGYVKMYNSDAVHFARLDAVKFVKIADANVASVVNKNILVSDDVKLSFVTEQVSSITSKVSLVDTQTGAVIPSSIALDTGNLGVTINPDANLSSSKVYTVVLDDDTIIGTKKWTIKTEDTVLEKLVINNRSTADGNGLFTSADSNGTYTETGVWTNSSLTGINEPYHANAAISNLTRATTNDPNTASAIYTPTIVNPGYYKISVYKFYTNTDGTTNNGPIDTITEIQGSGSVVNFNKLYTMRQVGSTYIKEWESVGIYNFNAGTSGYFKISKRVTGINSSMLRTDAVKFERVPFDDALPTVSVKNSNTNAVTLQFSKIMDISNMNYQTLSLKEKNTGTVIATNIIPQNDGKTVKLIPTSTLNIGTQYTISVSDKMIDLQGFKASGTLVYDITAAAPALTIASVVSNGNVIASGNISSTITATNKKDVDEVVNSIIGVYVGNTLVDIKFQPFTITSGSENQTYTMNHSLKSDLATGATMKAFVWNDLDGITPLK